jgi:hypothetical protein
MGRRARNDGSRICYRFASLHRPPDWHPLFVLVSILDRQPALRRGRRRTLCLCQNDGMQRCDHNRRLCAKPIFWTEFAVFHLRPSRLRQFRERINKLRGTTRSYTIYYSNHGYRVLPLKGSHMDEPHPTDELAGLRQFLERLESGYMRLRRNQVDVTKSEICILKREVSRLERILVRAKSRDQNAPAVRNFGRHRFPRQSSLTF